MVKRYESLLNIEVWKQMKISRVAQATTWVEKGWGGVRRKGKGLPKKKCSCSNLTSYNLGL